MIHRSEAVVHIELPVNPTTQAPRNGLILRGVDRFPHLADPRIKSPAQRHSAIASGVPLLPSDSNNIPTLNVTADHDEPNDSTVTAPVTVSTGLEPPPLMERVLGRVVGNDGYRGYLVKFADRENASHVTDGCMDGHYLDHLVQYYLDALQITCPAEFL